MENSEEVQIPADPQLIEDAEAVVLNKKIAAVVGSYFRALATLSDEDIFKTAFTPEGKESPRLLELVNLAFESMLSAGGDLPQGHFGHYTRIAESFTKTLNFNIETKLDINKDLLLAKATGKTESPDRISHQDIIDALSK